MELKANAHFQSICYVEISVDGTVVTPTEASPYEDTRLRIILFQQASLTWYKTYFKNADLSLLSAWSASGIKYAVSMPENTPINFTGMV